MNTLQALPNHCMQEPQDGQSPASRKVGKGRMAVPTIGGVAGCIVRVGTLRFVHPTARLNELLGVSPRTNQKVANSTL